MYTGSVGYRWWCYLQWCCDIISPNIWCCTDFAHKCGGVVYLPQIHSLLIHLMLMLPCCFAACDTGLSVWGDGGIVNQLVDCWCVWVLGGGVYVAKRWRGVFVLPCCHTSQKHITWRIRGSGIIVWGARKGYSKQTRGMIAVFVAAKGMQSFISCCLCMVCNLMHLLFVHLLSLLFPTCSRRLIIPTPFAFAETEEWWA